MNFLEEEGVKSSFKYKNKIDLLFNNNPSDDLSQSETEIMLSTMYLFYAQKVYNGIETQKTTEIGWLLARKKISYESLLDSLLIDPKLLIKNEKQVFGQYYKLKEILKKYRQIEQNKVWKPIEKDSLFREFKPFDSSKTIGQIRDRLFITGDLKQNSKSNSLCSHTNWNIVYFTWFGIGDSLCFTNQYEFVCSRHTKLSLIIKLSLKTMQYRVLFALKASQKPCKYYAQMVFLLL